MNDAAITPVSKRDKLESMKPSDMLTALSRVDFTKIDTNKMEQIMLMYERVAKQERERSYMEAMARLQGRLPQIDKSGHIDLKQDRRIAYALLEDIDTAIRPLLAEEGFSASYNEEEIHGGERRYSCKLSHKDGHSETKYITLPLDQSGSKNAVQSAGSTFSYARRYLLQAHLNLVAKGEDTDGTAVIPITEEQLKGLELLLKESGVDKAKFLEWAGVGELKDLPQFKLNDAIFMLDRRLKQKKASQ